MQRFRWPRRAPWLVVGLVVAVVAGAAAAVAVAGGGQPADLTFTPTHATQFTNIDVARQRMYLRSVGGDDVHLPLPVPP